MQTLQPIIRLGRDVWDRNNLPATEFQARVERLRAEMNGMGVEALLLYGKAHDDCGYPVYLSYHVLKSPRPSLVILLRQGDPVLVVQETSRGLPAIQATTWIEDIRTCSDVAETGLAVLAEKGLRNAPLGLAGVRRYMPHGQWLKLAAGLEGAKLVDAEQTFDRQRAIKSAREIAQVRRASQIVRRALEEHATGRFGVINESLLAAHLIRSARMEGAEDVRLLIGRPVQSEWSLRPVEDATVGGGEKIILHIAACRERYWAEATRTYLAGPEGLVICNDGADATFNAVAANLKPGRTAAEYVRAAVSQMGALHAELIEEYGLGNGIGITVKEPPILSAGDETTIEPGMCIALRVALPDPRGGFVLRSETVVVEKDGASMAA
jgi:Xaa-Pro aminopeptidase